LETEGEIGRLDAS